MPGSSTNDTIINTGHNNGLSPTSNRLDPPTKDITKVQRARRLNEYITIPRRPRPHPQNPQDYVQTTISQNHATIIEPEGKQCVQTKPDNSGSPEKRERSWSFKKIRQALVRSKSFGKSREGEESDSSCSKDKDVSQLGGVISMSESTLNRSQDSTDKPHQTSHRSENDIYAELDTVQCRLSLNSSDLSDKSSTKTGSSGSMAGTSSTMDRRASGTVIENKNVVGKVLSSLSNLTTRRRLTKKHKQFSENSDYYHTDFSSDTYRSSFKDTSHRHRSPPTSEVKRSKSFNTPSKNVSQNENINTQQSDPYSRTGHYDMAGDDGIYSLAGRDTPPPLPERTYLKLRTQTSNPIPVRLHPPQMGYDATGKSVTYATSPRHSSYQRSSTHQGGSGEDQPHHASSAVPYQGGYPTAKAFMLHRPDLNHNTDSSGYGSVNSDTFSMDSDYSAIPASAVPPLSCKLPRRSRRVSENGPPLPLRNSQSTGYYSNSVAERNQQQQKSEDTTQGILRPSSGDQRRSDQRSSQLELQFPRNKVHNLPLLPDHGKIELVQTIDLENILKDKWISGLAVTRKNEYIVVDQREAYLLDEDGTLRKSIGSKGSTRLIEPLSVTVMPSNGNLVFCDHAEQDIKIYNWKGQFLRKVRDQGLTNIAGVAATEDRNVIIAGTDKKRVSVLGEEGKLLYTIPGDLDTTDKSSSPKKSPFEHPYSVAVNPLTGDIIIGDDSKQVVTAVAPCKDGQPARILWRYSPGSGKRHFFPSSICADSNGYIFIADLYNEMVYMLDSGGKFVKTLLSRGNGLKGGPGAIATDGRGHLLVADEEKTLKVFRYDDENGFAVNKRYSFCPHAS